MHAYFLYMKFTQFSANIITHHSSHYYLLLIRPEVNVTLALKEKKTPPISIVSFKKRSKVS